MKKKDKTPYFFDETKSEFCKEDFNEISSQKFHLNKELTNNLQGKIFIYDNKEIKNNIIFYYINYAVTNKNDLQELHLRLLSEDKADFYAIENKTDNKNIRTELIYTKTTYENRKVIINSEDEEFLQTINKTSIDTGSFWIYYKNILEEAKTTNIRDRLVEILSKLRTDLKEEIKDDKYVQVLIDRTLYIKFLEDRHIINSYFYGEYREYKNILKSKSPKELNNLFAKVQKIFNNYLFEKPDIKIPENILTKKVFQVLQDTIEGVENGQLTLFDLKFDIIPIEAISQIYEIFYDKDQRKKGIYYTPKQLTNLITKETIDKKGRIIDIATGSGSFLISAYKQLISFKQTKNNSVREKIDYRINLIKEYIFGIEKEETARRLAIFSLYLSVLEDLSVAENEELKELLKNEKNYPLFIKNIGENIICSNTFEKNKFDNAKFDFVIGNPPWKKDFEDRKALKYYEENENSFSGKRELSELFLHKAKNWENKNTRYGFVVNTSNFTNEYSKFQDFFYKSFNIEKFYEVTDLEFFTASEPAIVCIYTGKKQENNKLILNVLKANDFTKLFKNVFIFEEDNIVINQDSLIKSDNQKNIPLRNFLVGGDGDFTIINYLESNRFEKFENYILKDEKGDFFIHQGIKTYAKKALKKAFDIDISKLSNEKTNEYKAKFKDLYMSKNMTDKFNIPYVKPNNISKFIFNSNKINLFLGEDISMLHRARSPLINIGDRIIIPNHGNSFKAVFIKDKSYSFYPSADLSVLKLNNYNSYFFTAILNSRLVEYYLKVKSWSRADEGHSRINQDAIPLVPISKNKNSKIITKVESLSKQLTEEKIKFEDKDEELNNLIYDLYGIGIIERQRINDFFISDKKKNKATTQDLNNYANEFCEYIADDLKPNIKIVTEVYNEKMLVKGISIVKIYFGQKGKKYPTSKKISRYLLIDLLKNATKENILTLRNRIYGENTIYIIKDSHKKSWTLTKAGEDAIAELDKINKYNSKNK